MNIIFKLSVFIFSLLFLCSCTIFPEQTKPQPNTTPVRFSLDDATPIEVDLEEEKQTTQPISNVDKDQVNGNNSKIGPQQSLYDILTHVKATTSDIHTLSFHTTTTSLIFYEKEKYPNLNYLLFEQQVFQGSLFRYSEQANYSIEHFLDERNESGESINHYTNKMDYQVNNQTVYFTDEFGNKSYYTFNKENTDLETIGQLDNKVDIFIEHEANAELYPLDKKLYVNLTLPSDSFVEHYSLLNETVFNGYFNSKTEEELQEYQLNPESNWPTNIYSNTISLVLNEQHNLESYYVSFESDAYTKDTDTRYSFTLMTILSNINELSTH